MFMIRKTKHGKHEIFLQTNPKLYFSTDKLYISTDKIYLCCAMHDVPWWKFLSFYQHFFFFFVNKHLQNFHISAKTINTILTSSCIVISSHMHKSIFTCHTGNWDNQPRESVHSVFLWILPNYFPENYNV